MQVVNCSVSRRLRVTAWSRDLLIGANFNFFAFEFATGDQCNTRCVILLLVFMLCAVLVLAAADVESRRLARAGVHPVRMTVVRREP